MTEQPKKVHRYAMTAVVLEEGKKRVIFSVYSTKSTPSPNMELTCGEGLAKEIRDAACFALMEQDREKSCLPRFMAFHKEAYWLMPPIPQSCLPDGLINVQELEHFDDEDCEVWESDGCVKAKEDFDAKMKEYESNRKAQLEAIRMQSMPEMPHE